MATTAEAIDNDVITSEVFIAAPRARVFQALTDPAQIPQWWGQQGMYRTRHFEGDLRPGGKWRQDGENAAGEPFHLKGEYLVVDPPHRLSHTWTATWTGDLATKVEWTLEAATEQGRPGTLVKLRHSGFAGSGASEAHDQGWKRVFGWVQDYLERRLTTETRSSGQA